MPLVVRRNENETWREVVKRIAARHGLWIEAFEEFDHCIEAGSSEESAAFDALYEWDLLDYEDDDGKPVDVAVIACPFKLIKCVES